MLQKCNFNCNISEEKSKYESFLHRFLGDKSKSISSLHFVSVPPNLLLSTSPDFTELTHSIYKYLPQNSTIEKLATSKLGPENSKAPPQELTIDSGVARLVTRGLNLHMYRRRYHNRNVNYAAYQ